MKLILEIITLALLATTTFSKLQCNDITVDIPSEWVDMVEKCTNAVRKQIQMEVKASFEYLSMAAHFARDTINRPGFAEHYFAAAKEERSHAMVLIDYLTMRGKLTDNISDLIKLPIPEKTSWDNATHSLTDALELETSVTKSIRDVIKDCEKDPFNDYHLVDYLTGVYLEEQYKGQRELAGKLSTLKKMMEHHGEIGEFLFDKTLLE